MDARSLETLRAALLELEQLKKQLDALGRLRIDVARLETRLRGVIEHEDDEKTPVRSPSTDALEAFRTSSRFLNHPKK